MKKRLAVLGVVIGAAVFAILMARKAQSSVTPEERELQSQRKRQEMFGKIQEGFEAMPSDFAPVVMFDNVEATRKNSEKILELLEEKRTIANESLATVAN